jgi:hypothetical protein
MLRSRKRASEPFSRHSGRGKATLSEDSDEDADEDADEDTINYDDAVKRGKVNKLTILPKAAKVANNILTKGAPLCH